MNMKTALRVLKDKAVKYADTELSDAADYIVNVFALNGSKIVSPALCDHCKRPTYDYYMLKDSIWRHIHPSWKGLIHLKCAEELLGRELVSVEKAKGIQ